MLGKFLLLPVSAMLACSAMPVGAATINFNQPTYFFAVPSYSEQGVTFRSTDTMGTISTQATPNVTYGFVAFLGDGNFAPARADIAGGAGMVSIDVGGYAVGFTRDIYLNVYNASNTLVGSTTALIQPGVTGMPTLSVSAPNIAYAIFGGHSYLCYSSFYYDNFTFGAGIPAGAVPEPASWALMIAGFALAGATLRQHAAQAHPA
jgi:hypothetical protein